MTEQEWLTFQTPNDVIHCVDEQFGKIGFRKKRLLMCAWCRQAWHHLTDPQSQHVVQIAERYADSGVTKDSMISALYALPSVSAKSWRHQHRVAGHCAFDDGWQQWIPLSEELAALRWLSLVEQSLILRDIIGNPFQPLTKLRTECSKCSGSGKIQEGFQVTVDCAACVDGQLLHPWLTWNYSTVFYLAQSAYEQRMEDGSLDDSRLQILADALEESGCTDEQMLMPLRGNRIIVGPACYLWDECYVPRYRGFYVLDAILGYQ